jgi:hypothetical protein
MGWTKRQFVEQAFDEVGYAAHVFDLQPEQIQSALWRLDSMMAAWNAKGIRVGYPVPGSPNDSDIDDQTNVPDSANEAIYLNLAIRIAPSIGKVVSPDTKANAKMAYDTLLSIAAMPMEMQLPATMPSGAGNRPWNIEQPFIRPPVDPLLAGQDSAIDFN